MKKGLLVILLFMVAAIPLFAQNNEGLKIGDTTWKFNGEIRFMYTDQTSFDGYFWSMGSNFLEGTDTFNRLYQRYRFGVEGALSDRISAVFTIQVGDEQWGNKNYNEREVNLRTLYAYLQFRPEFLGDDTTFRVGLQGYDDIFQYSIFSDEAIGIIVNHSNDVMNANIGYLSLRDDDVNADFDDEGLLPCSETLFLADMSYKANDKLTVKGAFYYDYLRDIYVGYIAPWNGSARYGRAFYGAGADYLLNENVSFGGHFVASSGTLTLFDNESDPPNEFEYAMKGWFGYAYATYSMDKFSAKVNFGYTPYNSEEDSKTYWTGAFILPDLDPALVTIPRVFTGDQWQTAYGLEYYGRGDVCDRQAVNGGYGGMYGLMVISANISYDFAFANFGIMRATDSTDYPDGFPVIDKSIGTELDLGVKAEIMKGFEVKAVYAMFFTGDFWKYGNEATTLENAHEMSMLLRYTF